MSKRVFKLRQGASISANVGLSLGLLVGVLICPSLRGKSVESKKQNLIIFDYLIHFWHCWVGGHIDESEMCLPD